MHIYADDITITCTGSTIPELRSKVQSYLDIFQTWTEDWGFQVNPQKSVVQFFSKKRNISCPVLRLKGNIFSYKKEHRLLGLILDSPRLSWKPHIDMLVSDCQRKII